MATGIGSMPGTDVAEAAAIVFGELTDLPHLPELPARGVGADTVGRTAAMLVDIAVDVVPTGYRIAPGAGRHHRRAVDLLRWDVDAVTEAAEHAGTTPWAVKTQVSGPWSLAADVELARGSRVLTDHGATRDVVESLLEGLAAHVSQLSERTRAPVVVQFDEPLLPDVLAGALPTASGYGTVPAVVEPEARELLRRVLDRTREITGGPVFVRCGARRPPVGLLHSAGADVLALDATQLDGAPGALLDEIGEAWDAGVHLGLGVVPGEPPAAPPQLDDVARPALNLVDRLGFPRSVLAERAVVTPSCGLAGATGGWLRRALSLTRDVGKAFVEPPERW